MVQPRQCFPRLLPLCLCPCSGTLTAKFLALSLPDAPSIPPSLPTTDRSWPWGTQFLLATGTSSAEQQRANPPKPTSGRRLGSHLGIPRAGIPKGFCFLSKGCSWCHTDPPEGEGGQGTTAQLSWTWWLTGHGPAVLDVAVAFSLHSAQPVCLTKNASPMSHGLRLGTLA